MGIPYWVTTVPYEAGIGLVASAVCLSICLSAQNKTQKTADMKRMHLVWIRVILSVALTFILDLAGYLPIFSQKIAYNRGPISGQICQQFYMAL